MVAVLVLMAMVRLRLLNFSLERDEGEYAYAGQLLLHGIPPYKLAFNMKFPGTYAMYALIMALFGETPAGIHFGLTDHHHADGADALLAGQANAGFDCGHGGGGQLCRSRGQHRVVRIGGPRHPLRGVFCDRRFVFDVESPADGAMANGRGRGNHVRHGDADETTRGHHRGVGIRSFCMGIFRKKRTWNSRAADSGGVCGRGRAAVGIVLFDALVRGGFSPVLVLDGGLCAPIYFNRVHFRHRLAILVERPLDGFGRFLAVAAVSRRIWNDLV